MPPGTKGVKVRKTRKEKGKLTQRILPTICGKEEGLGNEKESEEETN